MVFDSGARQLFSWEEVIDEKPLTASSQTLLPHALAKFVAQSDTSCMIALRHGKVAGIVTRQDLLSAIAHKANWARLRLTKVMTHPVITVAKSELSLVAASLLQQFKQHQISHLPVVDDDNTLIGIISYRHLLVIFREQKAEISIKRQHQHAQLFAEITLKIRQSLQLKEILQTTAEEVQKLLDADRVVIYQVLPDGTGKTTSEAVKDPYPAVLGMAFPEEVFPTEYQQLYAKGRVHAIRDVLAPNSGIAECLLEFIKQWGIRAKLIVPIVHPLASDQAAPRADSHQLWGLLIAHQCSGPRQWTDFELEFMQQLAAQISIALSQGQMLEYLEERVNLRTAELTEANRALQPEIQERKQIEIALRQSEEQLRLITNNLPVLIAYVDAQQCYRFNNQAYEYWLGQNPAELYGSPIKAFTQPDHYQNIRPHIETALMGEQVTYESELILKDSRRHSVSVSYIPHLELINQNQAKINGFFALTTDISDRKAIERMKDEFIAVVSHELRTPLTSLHGSLKLIATGRLGNLSEAGQQMLAVADESTDRLVRLVNNVLDLQRIESGEVTMDNCTCNAAELVEQAAEAMQTMAQQHGIEIHTQLKPLFIWADPDYIVQTLTNLIGNAIKFSAPHKTILLSLQPHSATPQLLQGAAAPSDSPASAALFCVKDDGQGVPSDKLDSIFERFHQVDSSDSRKKGGTGLGLAICRKIIEQHGGKIWAESEAGVGSKFYFTVPLSHDQIHD